MMEDWKLVGEEHEVGRLVFCFEHQYTDAVQVRITVSRTFREPEAEAWRLLKTYLK